MTTMKATLHIGKGSADHNDLSYDKNKNDSIIYPNQPNIIYKRSVVYDEEKQKNVLRYVSVQEGHHILKQHEKSYYEQTFRDSLDAKNQRYIKQGHKERCKSMNQVYNNAKTEPTEMILQIGNRDNPFLDASKFHNTIRDFTKELRNKYPNMHVLDFAIHQQEEALHCHLRYVLVAKDKEGNLEPNKTAAYKEMGIERPDMTKKVDRYNNPEITFTNTLREQWCNCIERNNPEIEIDREVKTPGISHMDTHTYKRKQEIKKLDDMIYNRKEQLATLDTTKFDAMMQFLKEKGLEDEFKKFYQNEYDYDYDYEYD